MARQLWREQLETTIHGAGMFDLRDWIRAGQRIDGLEKADQAGRQQLTGRPVQDTFFSLFKSDPRVAQDLKPGLKPLGDLLGRAIETPNFKQLHTTTQGDSIAAGFAAREFFEGFIQNLPGEVKAAAQEARKAQYTADEAADQAQAARDAAEAYRSLAQENDQAAQGHADTAQDLADQGEDAQADAHEIRADELHHLAQDAENEADRLEALAQALESVAAEQGEIAQTLADTAQEAIENNAAQIAHQANQAADQADENTKEALTFVKGFSQAAGGDPSSLDPEALKYGMELFKRFPQVADFAKILGWVKRVAKAEYRNSPKGRTEFKGYHLGELNLAHMAAHEWVAFAGGRNIGRRDWVRRVANGEISHNDYEGKEQEGRGPIVWVVDQSGSMSGPGAILSKCIEWALIDIAQADGREFHCISFAGFGNWDHWQAPAGKADYKGLFEHMRKFKGGGTEPYGPLTEAVKLIEAGDLEADIVLTTDGIFDVPPAEFIKELEAAKARRPLRIETILVDAGQIEDHEAAKFSDRLTHLSSFITDKSKVRDLLKAVV